MPEHDKIEEYLTMLSQREVKHWGIFAYTLDYIDRTEYWREQGASSLSSFISFMAKFYEKKPATLWRYLTSGRHYNAIVEKYAAGEEKYPQLCDISDQVSPEKLEILSKIARAAPEDVVSDIALKVLDGEITKANLWALWQAYKPALEGKTARGRGTTIPSICQTDLRQISLVSKSNVLSTIYQAEPEWIGVDGIDLFIPFVGMTFSPPPNGRDPITFDMVAITRDGENRAIRLHCVAVISEPTPVSVDFAIKRFLPYFHFIWIAFPEDFDPSNARYIPDFAGILRVGRKNITTVRTAERSSFLGGRTEHLTQWLLIKALGC
jgi:hypothetical protein